MKNKPIDKIRKAITDEIAQTEILIKSYKDLTKPIAPENAIGRVSRMDAINNKAINENALRKAQLKLTNLTVALQNINDPNFGVCSSCNALIPLGRILIMPQSRFCVNCAR